MHAPPAAADATPFLGQIVCFPFNFVPIGWLPADGRLLPISQNTALFSLLGTTYGGNGTSNFALPDLRGRTMLGAGQGPGLSLRDLGETGGSEGSTLTMANLPTHSHTVAPPASSAPGSQSSPANGMSATNAGMPMYAAPASGTTVAMASGVTQPAGGGQPIDNMQPYLSLTCVIATQGIFPSRS
jgi:microcystin-dependent protein